MNILTRRSIIKKTTLVMAALGLPPFITNRLMARGNGIPLERVIDREALAESDGTWLLEVPGSGGKFFSLNRTAREVWDLIDGRNSAEAITRILASRYSLPEKEINEALLPLIASMKEVNLVI